MATLYYLRKMGGTKTPTLSKLAQDIWDYLIFQNISLSVEHIKGEKNILADRELRAKPDNSEWILNRNIFIKLCSIFGENQT